MSSSLTLMSSRTVYNLIIHHIVSVTALMICYGVISSQLTKNGHLPVVWSSLVLLWALWRRPQTPSVQLLRVKFPPGSLAASLGMDLANLSLVKAGKRAKYGYNHSKIHLFLSCFFLCLFGIICSSSDSPIGLTAWPWCIVSKLRMVRWPTAAVFCAVTLMCRMQKITELWCLNLAPWQHLTHARTSSPGSFHVLRFQVSIN